jgi:MFS transporter, SP family, arabinose:H+ symporter
MPFEACMLEAANGPRPYRFPERSESSRGREVPLEHPPRLNKVFLWRICLVAAMGGLLFGYDWVVIGGAKPFFTRYFGLEESAGLVGWAMSSALVGCMAGAVLSGALTDRFGRRRLLILAGFCFTVSALGTAVAASLHAFVWYRLLGGLGIGLASNLSPMYIAEVSPAKMRGRLVSVNQLTIVIGVVLAQTVNWAIARNLTPDFTERQILESWYGQVGWRWMFGAEAIPAILFFVLMFLVPESPRWLVKNGRFLEAERILARLGGDAYGRSEVSEIRRTLAEEEIARVRFRDLLEPRLARVILIGAILAGLQQWCGINVIFYYAEDVFREAGYGVGSIMVNIVYTGAIMLVFTFVAISTVDRLGRRPLMLVGSGGLALLHVLIGAGYFFGFKGIVLLLLVLAAIAVYSFTLAPVTWVLLSEIFPNRIRGAAMAIAVFTLWVTCWALAQVFPIMNARLGAAGSFWIFSAVCLSGFLYILKVLPETRGKSLERIEGELVDGSG